MLSRELERFAKKRGAELVGFTRSRNALSRLRLPWARSAVVLGLSIRHPLLATGVRYPSWEEPRQFIDVLMDALALSVEEFLEVRGYRAHAVGSGNRSIDLRSLVLASGLGVEGKNRLIVTPEFGPRVRFGAVVTDAVLEAEPRKVENLCRGCSLCRSACPAGALNGSFNASACESYNLALERESGLLVKKCTLCTDVCPVGRK